MLSNEHAHEEMEHIETIIAKETDAVKVLKGILKGISILIKLGLNHRTNQVLMMKKMGIELVKPPKKENINVKK